MPQGFFGGLAQVGELTAFQQLVVNGEFIHGMLLESGSLTVRLPHSLASFFVERSCLWKPFPVHPRHLAK